MRQNPALIYYWIDHTAKFASNTGMQRVARSLARALSRARAQVVFVRWDVERKGLVLSTRDELEHLGRFHGPRLEGPALVSYPEAGEVRLLHETEGFGALEGWLLVPEVTHVTFHEMPPTLDAILYARHHRIRSAFIFYDAIPLKLPEYSSSAEEHARYMQQIALADVVIPISHFVAKDYIDYLRTFLGFDRGTLPLVRPIGLAAGIEERPTRRSAVDNEETLILCVGTVEPRKNQIALINAFEQLCIRQPGRQVRLALVGHLHGAVEEFVREASGRNPRISYLEHVDDAELIALYDRSAFTVFPSIEEGFGLPILESLWHGRPCICANFGAMGEVAHGGGCLEVDVRSNDQLESAMERLVTDPALRSRLEDEAWMRPIKTWDEYGAELMGTLREIERLPRHVTRIFYCIDRIVSLGDDPGIQRLVGLVARSLIVAGVELVPVKWNAQEKALVAPGQAELARFASWGGPNIEAWISSQSLDQESADWLLMAEVATCAGGLDLASITACAAERGMRSAIVVCDERPHESADVSIHLDAAEHAHCIDALNGFDRVLATSDSVQVNLRNLLMKGHRRLIGLDDRVVVVPLPEEFRDTELTKDNPSSQNGDIEKGRNLQIWQSYGQQVLEVLGAAASLPKAHRAPLTTRLRSPVLSVCITTYNRAEWLDVSVRQLARFVARYEKAVELLVCDNASSDGTEAIAAAHRDLSTFRYVRNPVNVGMLGNLRETVQAAHGRFVWILGDDDIVRPGALERILGTILETPSLPLIYLNYAYTRHASPRQIGELEGFLASALPIVPPGPDRRARIAELAPLSENFFTGIYCLVFRRDHALRAYSQDVMGPPFSSLLTSIPTAYYVCNELFDEVGHWIGEPAVVVNMNVSWERYAPLWVLERLPELYELAEIRGADPTEMDRWRIRNLRVAADYMSAIYFDDRAQNREHFSFERFIRRHGHLDEFRDRLPEFTAAYRRAYEQGRVRGEPHIEELLRRFALPLD